VIRLTSDRDLLRDEAGEIGFLGRAHPLVRRALDRVRNLQFGGGSGLDRRVSAALVPGSRAGVLWTFLGSLRSSLGRAFERVIAVRVDQGAAPALVPPREWMALPARPTRTLGLWESNFAAWAEATEDPARTEAGRALSSLFAEFRAATDTDLAQERRELDAWLRARAEALTSAPVAETLTLFGTTPAGPSWRSRRDPKERLAAFAADSEVPVAQRREGEGLLKLHQDRLADLDRRRPHATDTIVPLGMLLLVPESPA
jgi:hypothetical protein